MLRTIPLFILILLSGLFSILGTAAAYSNNTCPKNCYPMLILRVIDADSVQGYIHTNDKESVIFTTLRLDGIDTPETKKSQCMIEELQGMKATAFLKKKLEPIIRQRSTNKACACDYRGGKFAKRRVGELKIKKNQKWQSVTRPLKSRCFAASYTKGKRPNWCDCLNKGICPAQYFSPKCVKKLPKIKHKYNK